MKPTPEVLKLDETEVYQNRRRREKEKEKEKRTFLNSSLNPG